MIAIVNYGLGNVKAFVDVLNDIGEPCFVATRSDELRSATKIILPGVGAFDSAMRKLNVSGMRDTLDDLVLSKGIPTLGVCVGMQLFGDESEEGSSRGLGWIKGRVQRIDHLRNDNLLPLPHMGWNRINPKADAIFERIDSKSYFYFLHSFAFSCVNEKNIIANSFYGCELTCAIRQENIVGVQFHPEKSHSAGVALIANFCRLK